MANSAMTNSRMDSPKATGSALLDDLGRSMPRPRVGTLDIDDRDDRGGLVLVDDRLHSVDDAGERDLPFQEGHDGDLVRGVHHRREREPQTADTVGEIDRGEGF